MTCENIYVGVVGYNNQELGVVTKFEIGGDDQGGRCDFWGLWSSPEYCFWEPF